MDPIVVFLVSLFSLISASEFFLKNILSYSRKIRMETFFIGSIIISLSTSLPELFNGINSVILGHGEIALGDVIGSCITNFGFVLGTLILFKPFRIEKTEKYYIRVSTFAFSIMLFFLVDGVISKLEGLLLFSLFLACYFYSFYFLKGKESIGVNYVRMKDIYPELSKMAIYLFFIILSSSLLIKSSIEISKILLVPTSVIGLSLIAFSTSFPEITIAILSSFKKEQKLSFGDVIGSNILNICLIIGLTSMIAPIEVNKIEFLFPVVIYLIILFVIEYSVEIMKGFNRVVGFILVSLYLFYMAGLPTFR